MESYNYYTEKYNNYRYNSIIRIDPIYRRLSNWFIESYNEYISTNDENKRTTARIQMDNYIEILDEMDK